MAQHAYDLSAFEERKPSVVALKPNRKALRAKTRQNRAQAVLNAVVTALAIAAATGIVLLMIVSRVRITQINNDIAALEDEISILQSENVRLKGEIVAIASAESVENYAQANGMTKVEQHQVRYFSVDDTDSAEIPTDGNGNFLVSIWEGITGLFG